MDRKYWWLLSAILFALTAIVGIQDVFSGEDFIINLLTFMLCVAIAYFSWTKFKNKSIKEPLPYSIQIVGYQYYQPELKPAFEARGNIQNVEVFDGVELIPEPTNQHDHNAVMIKLDGVKIGYVPADKTHEVKQMLNRNKMLRMYEYKGYIRAELTLL